MPIEGNQMQANCDTRKLEALPLKTPQERSFISIVNPTAGLGAGCRQILSSPCSSSGFNGQSMSSDIESPIISR